MRPMHTGIIANDWIDFSSPLDDKEIYCVEDESVPGSTHDKYTVSPDHLMVPTLGERMKAADPATRVVSVAGKDRSAVLMGGHKVDEVWWWDRNSRSEERRVGREWVSTCRSRVSAQQSKKTKKKNT